MAEAIAVETRGRVPTDQTNFIRALSASLSVPEMVTECAKAGYQVTFHSVYQTRRRYGLKYRPLREDEKRPSPKRKRGKRKATPVRRTTAREAMAALEATGRPGRADGNVRDQVRRLALRVGVERLEELVREIAAEAGL